MPLSFSAAEKSIRTNKKKQTHSKLSIPHTTVWWDNSAYRHEHIPHIIVSTYTASNWTLTSHLRASQMLHAKICISFWQFSHSAPIPKLYPTRGAAITDGSSNTVCQLKSCQLLTTHKISFKTACNRWTTLKLTQMVAFDRPYITSYWCSTVMSPLCCTTAEILTFLRYNWLSATFRSYLVLKQKLQEGQHPLTGQRATNFRRDLEAT